MNADSTPTERDDVAAVLAAHESRAQNLDGDWMCACGSFLCPPNDDRLDRAHREHIAKVIERVVIAAREQATRAEAEAKVARVEALADEWQRLALPGMTEWDYAEAVRDALGGGE